MNNTNKITVTSPRAVEVSQEASQFGDASTMQRLFSSELFAGNRELAIMHNDEEYRLRITSKGKLILTK